MNSADVIANKLKELDEWIDRVGAALIDYAGPCDVVKGVSVHKTLKEVREMFEEMLDELEE